MTGSLADYRQQSLVETTDLWSAHVSIVGQCTHVSMVGQHVSMVGQCTREYFATAARHLVVIGHATQCTHTTAFISIKGKGTQLNDSIE